MDWIKIEVGWRVKWLECEYNDHDKYTSPKEKPYINIFLKNCIPCELLS